MLSTVCASIDSMIDGGTPPDLLIDLAYGGTNSEVTKSLSATLGIPTVSSTMGQEDDIT